MEGLKGIRIEMRRWKSQERRALRFTVHSVSVPIRRRKGRRKRAVGFLYGTFRSLACLDAFSDIRF